MKSMSVVVLLVSSVARLETKRHQEPISWTEIRRFGCRVLVHSYLQCIGAVHNPSSEAVHAPQSKTYYPIYTRSGKCHVSGCCHVWSIRRQKIGGVSIWEARFVLALECARFASVCKVGKMFWLSTKATGRFSGLQHDHSIIRSFLLQ